MGCPLARGAGVHRSSPQREKVLRASLHMLRVLLQHIPQTSAIRVSVSFPALSYITKCPPFIASSLGGTSLGKIKVQRKSPLSLIPWINWNCPSSVGLAALPSAPAPQKSEAERPGLENSGAVGGSPGWPFPLGPEKLRAAGQDQKQLHPLQMPGAADTFKERDELNIGNFPGLKRKVAHRHDHTLETLNRVCAVPLLSLLILDHPPRKPSSFPY